MRPQNNFASFGMLIFKDRYQSTRSTLSTSWCRRKEFDYKTFELKVNKTLNIEEKVKNIFGMKPFHFLFSVLNILLLLLYLIVPNEYNAKLLANTVFLLPMVANSHRSTPKDHLKDNA